MKKLLSLSCISILAITMALTGCGANKDNGESTSESGSTKFQVTELPQLEGVKSGDTIATIKTNMGDIKVWFFPEYAPKAVENFTTHAKEGYYDNLIFHRVINDFMIQGGDPLGTGTGGESIWGADFENETTPNLRSFRGALCMANAGPDTNGSQFYIVQAKNNSSIKTQIGASYDQVIDSDGNKISDAYPEDVIEAYEKLGGYPSLDFGYTIFGQVYEGMDVVDKIAAVKTNESDKPVEDVVITGIEVGTY